MNPKTTTCLLGAIAGDMIGVPYERHIQTDTDFPLFTSRSTFSDDTVLTIAVAEALLTDGNGQAAIQRWGRRYPNAGYGGYFLRWLKAEKPAPYNSFGNGSAMRVSPIGWAFDTLEETLKEARQSAICTHNHPEGVKGAQAIAAAIFLARTGASKSDIQQEIETRFQYDLSRSLEEIRPTYEWDVTCQGSVPESLIAFLEADDVESAIRNAILLGGDADTMAAIAGSVAEACYGGVPEASANEALRRLNFDMRAVVENFGNQFCNLALPLDSRRR